MSSPLTSQFDGGTNLIHIWQLQGLMWYFDKLGDIFG